MTYRFEEENFAHTYVMEDYYCTNPFCDCNHVTVSFCDQEDESNRIPFLLNFNKTQGPLPGQPKLTQVQNEIIKGFVKNLQDEMIVLFKQRYMEAKAYGEKNPLSYLILEPGRYVNYLEMFPRNTQTLDFKYGEDPYFAEDAYELDPRNQNRDIKMAFFKLELDNAKNPPIFTYTYHFNESLREKQDAKLEADQSNMLMGLHQGIPDLLNILKKRYKEAKETGKQMIQNAPGPELTVPKTKPNDPCPCGSGKKFKKCCGLNLN